MCLSTTNRNQNEEAAQKGSCVTILPRRRKGSPLPHADPVKRPVFLTSKDILALFHMQQKSAADKLGISLTALKMACKKLGLPRWPYMRTSPAEAEKEKGKGKEKEGSQWATTSLELGELMEDAMRHCCEEEDC
ncbi:hypothetical protein GUITHDRAFT_118741 [Guillardia theta CCMP2712]|uniref:RWP-RK domain-containing protein n=1 Tax=Guillardia theta (strain CCMP2712) TaxID=905079 RepID=L1IGX5_GUITC|nr:hypothetical protein GUITHDRAFT_118741 [Guillardia theta CCMP2712]EKX35085.1 hypothetical protein GUITHDRAFT_118741 [Guillardia theta CCMP2712]|eukprot:XP_005822065.1 hypothetical protein GUITHDRAFT_118741 [Guillardia theta CCMP2712]